MRINVTKSSMPDFDEYCDEIKTIWENYTLTNCAEKHQRLEKELEEYLGVRNVVLFTNGHLALEYMIQALELSGEIITTPFTFASTTNSIARMGIKPVFCDIKEDDYTIDPQKLEALITPQTTAIMPVHVYGRICDTQAIDEIASKHGIYVIYDAAHAFGVKKDGVSAAQFGHAAMFSFHATKVFNTIEGGCVATNDDELAQKLVKLKNFGLGDDKSDCVYAGGNGKMNEFQAAMGLCNLRHLSAEINKRQTVYDRYIKNLSSVQGISIPPKQENVISNYAYFPIIVKEYKYSVEEILSRLAKNDIGARRYFYPAVNEMSCYRYLGQENSTPLASDISKNVLTLPMYAGLSLEDVDLICDIIKGK